MHKLKRLWNKIRYGLFLQYIVTLLGKVGLKITPYYWTLEQFDQDNLPTIEGDFGDFQFGLLGPEELKLISEEEPVWFPQDMLMARHEKGNKCFGAKHNGRIAGFTWIDLDECNFKPKQFALKENEAYLFNLYIMKSFRGRNLAPYLRLKCNEELTKLGRTTIYSVTEYLNPPSIKFKKKLKAKFLYLALYLELFKKFERHWVLKNYPT